MIEVGIYLYICIVVKNFTVAFITYLYICYCVLIVLYSKDIDTGFTVYYVSL